MLIYFNGNFKKFFKIVRILLVILRKLRRNFEEMLLIKILEKIAGK